MAPQSVEATAMVLSLSGSSSIPTTTTTTSRSFTTRSLSQSSSTPALKSSPTFLSFEGTYPLAQGSRSGEDKQPKSGSENPYSPEDGLELATPTLEVTTVVTPYVGVLPSFASVYHAPTSTQRTHGKPGFANTPAFVVMMAVFLSVGALVVLAICIFFLHRRLVRRGQDTPKLGCERGEKGDGVGTGEEEVSLDEKASIGKGNTSGSPDSTKQSIPDLSPRQVGKRTTSISMPILSPPRSFSIHRLPRVQSLRVGSRPPPILVPDSSSISHSVILVQSGSGADSPRLPRDIIRRQCSAQRLGFSPSTSPTSSMCTSQSPSPSANASLVSFSSILPQYGLSRSLTSPRLPPSRSPSFDAGDSLGNDSGRGSWLGGDITVEPSGGLLEARLPESYSWDFRCRGLGYDDGDDGSYYGRINSMDFKAINSAVPVIQVIVALESSNALAAKANNAPPMQDNGTSGGEERLTTQYSPKIVASSDSIGFLDYFLSNTNRESRLLEDISATLAARLSCDLASVSGSGDSGDSATALLCGDGQRSGCTCDADEDVDAGMGDSFLSGELSMECGSPPWIGIAQPANADGSGEANCEGDIEVNRVDVAQVQEEGTCGDVVLEDIPSTPSDPITLELSDGVRSFITTIPEPESTPIRSSTPTSTSRGRSGSGSEPSSPVASRHREVTPIRSILKPSRDTSEIESVGQGKAVMMKGGEVKITWSSSTTSVKKVKERLDASDEEGGDEDGTIESCDLLDSYIAPLILTSESRSDATASTPKKFTIPKPSRIPIATPPRHAPSVSTRSRSPVLALEIDELFSSHTSLSNIASSLSASFSTVSGPRTPSSSNGLGLAMASPSPSRFIRGGRNYFSRGWSSNGNSLISSPKALTSRIAVRSPTPSPSPQPSVVSQGGNSCINGSPSRIRVGKLSMDKYFAFTVSDAGAAQAMSSMVGMTGRKPLGEVTNSTGPPSTPKRVRSTAITVSPKPAWR